MIRVAINGYGRIGRCVLRALYERGYRDRAAIVAVNDIADHDLRVHLTRYDSNHGRFHLPVQRSGNDMVIGSDTVPLLAEPDCGKLPWRSIGVDIVLDCTGLAHRRADAERHIEAGAGRVLLSYPGPSDVDLTAVYGYNHHLLTAEHRIVSNASCTSNCAVPVLAVIDRAFGVEMGSITVVHSLLNDQPLADSYHNPDPQKTRAGMHSMVPVDTRLAAGLARVMPHMKGRISASTVRVPTLNVSVMDFTLFLASDTNVRNINDGFTKASNSDFSGIMGVEHGPLVSVDFNHDPRSCIIAAPWTQVTEGRMLKLFAWFDNEWAYAVRMLDTMLAMVDA